jgi:hypothetical protein
VGDVLGLVLDSQPGHRGVLVALDLSKIEQLRDELAPQRKPCGSADAGAEKQRETPRAGLRRDRVGGTQLRLVERPGRVAGSPSHILRSGVVAFVIEHQRHVDAATVRMLTQCGKQRGQHLVAPRRRTTVSGADQRKPDKRPRPLDVLAVT